ncbi:hypothetical protein [uncultured Sphaerochaeta sp.]|uniref:hypothetical protein n=1 Tax=uncultured Sphaerochaeta sp. TaxID=886478 RepID=UPI002A0A99EF|nr:hypothetical protein [uncultured Sphaerochaeta sp.]
MKKSLPILILLTLLGFMVSCNSDASEGIFRQISQTTTPADIVYSRLLGLNTAKDTLFFQTADGIYKIANSSVNSASKLVESAETKLIKASAYDPSVHKLYVLTNGTDTFKAYDEDGTAQPDVSVTSTTLSSSSFIINNMYSNRMLVLKGSDAAYEITSYDGSSFNSIATFSSSLVNGYGLDNFLMQTTKHIDSAAPIIISFVNSDDTDNPIYKHYLVDPTGAVSLIDDITDIRIANFYYDSTHSNLYVLTYDGLLYRYTGVDSTLASTISNHYTLKDSSQDYVDNAFFYPVFDSDGATMYLISKNSTKASSLYIYTIANYNTAAPTFSKTTSISKGYASYLDSSNIVSALALSSVGTDPMNLLVATRKNGMYQLTISVDSANVNSTDNGSSSDSEVYSF